MKFFLSILITLSFLLNTDKSIAQDVKWPDLDKSPMQFSYFPAKAAWRNYLQGDDRNIRPKVKVTYSSPAKKERIIFGTLVPYGKEWRLGANEATEITFYQAVEIGGVTLNPGYYTMSATVNSDHWLVNFSTERHIWGNDNRDQDATVASIKVMTNATKESREHFAIGFKEIDDYTTHMIIEWDMTNVAIPISFNVTSFPGEDVSPGDMAHYPDNSRFTNYLKAEELEAAKPKVRVSYSRPQMKERKIFGELLKFGEVWRVGANESTEVTFFENVMIGDTEVRAGRYNLYAIVDLAEWTFILNNDMPAWGAANRDEEKDVAKITVPVTSDVKSLEALTITFKKQDEKHVDMLIGWDYTRAALPIKFK
jgi:hypothetical protein